MKFLAAANIHFTEFRFGFKQQKNLATAQQTNCWIWLGNLNDTIAKLSVMTFAQWSTSYIVYALEFGQIYPCIMKKSSLAT